MSDVTQIRVGKHITGIIGLKAALAEVAASCKGMPEEHIGKILLEHLSKRNYIEAGIAKLYEEAFLREFKRGIGAPVAEMPCEGVQIKVLGMGCPQCDRLEHDVMAVLAEIGIAAGLEHVRDPAEIGRYGVLGSPALVINGKVKAVGSVPPKPKIKAWIEQAAKIKI
jgi:hypothetical protein